MEALPSFDGHLFIYKNTQKSCQILESDNEFSIDRENWGRKLGRIWKKFKGREQNRGCEREKDRQREGEMSEKTENGLKPFFDACIMLDQFFIY